MRTVVVGHVATPEGEAALSRAVEEVRLREARLVVVISHRGGRDLDENEAHQLEARDAELVTRLESSGIDFEVRTLVRGFEPAEDLISIAETTDAELIVIGLRRRSPVGKLLLGSNAQRILLDAPCAVLAVKG